MYNLIPMRTLGIKFKQKPYPTVLQRFFVDYHPKAATQKYNLEFILIPHRTLTLTSNSRNLLYTIHNVSEYREVSEFNEKSKICSLLKELIALRPSRDQ